MVWIVGLLVVWSVGWLIDWLVGASRPRAGRGREVCGCE